MSDGLPLRIISLLEDLSDAGLSTIAACCFIRTYEKQAQILDAQEQTTGIFFILTGTVRFNSHTPTGREAILNEMSAGGIFGEVAAVDGLPRSAAVVAGSDCRVARMTAKKFLEVLEVNGK